MNEPNSVHGNPPNSSGDITVYIYRCEPRGVSEEKLEEHQSHQGSSSCNQMSK